MCSCYIQIQVIFFQKYLCQLCILKPNFFVWIRNRFVNCCKQLPTIFTFKSLLILLDSPFNSLKTFTRWTTLFFEFFINKKKFIETNFNKLSGTSYFIMPHSIFTNHFWLLNLNKKTASKKSCFLKILT